MAAYYPNASKERLPSFTRADSSGILVLPIAPQPVARTRFSPPHSALGQCLAPAEALRLLEEDVNREGESITLVLLSGPGDPLATPDLTIETAKKIHKTYRNLKVGLRTMGIGSENLASRLAEAGIRYVEMEVEAVRQEVLEKLFAWIRPGSKTIKLSDAAALLLQEQRCGVSALTFHNISVSIATTLYPGFNIDHAAKISEEMQELGAESISLTPYSPMPQAEVRLEQPSCEDLQRAKAKAGLHLPVLKHAEERKKTRISITDKQHEIYTERPSEQRPNIAVVSSNGIEVDLHLGHAARFLIYGPRSDGLHCLLESRNAPEPGTGKKRWLAASSILRDCFLLLAASAGDTPRRILSENGLQVRITDENIEGAVETLYRRYRKVPEKTQ